MRTRGKAALAAVAFVLAGCTPTAAPSDSASPSPSPTASATPSASATAAPSPSATASAEGLLLSTTGVGDLTIDLTAADVAAMTGRDYTAELSHFAPACGAFLVDDAGTYSGIGALVESGGTDGPVDTYSYNALSGYADPGAFTSDGLGVGSTLAEIQAVYGSALNRMDDLYMGDYESVWVDDGSTGIMFYLDDADVAYGWNVGRMPQLGYLEGCA